jgi:hypothetical protein
MCIRCLVLRSRTMRRHTANSRASAKSSHRRTRLLRPPASLLSTFSAVAGVQPKTSRSIKPRERDLRDLRLFVLVRFFTRPTNHPRHAVCASNYESKPVRPLTSYFTLTDRLLQTRPAVRLSNGTRLRPSLDCKLACTNFVP